VLLVPLAAVLVAAPQAETGSPAVQALLLLWLHLLVLLRLLAGAVEP
jgi:hypothetical protein